MSFYAIVKSLSESKRTNLEIDFDTHAKHGCLIVKYTNANTYVKVDSNGNIEESEEVNYSELYVLFNNSGALIAAIPRNCGSIKQIELGEFFSHISYSSYSFENLSGYNSLFERAINSNATVCYGDLQFKSSLFLINTELAKPEEKQNKKKLEARVLLYLNYCKHFLMSTSSAGPYIHYKDLMLSYKNVAKRRGFGQIYTFSNVLNFVVKSITQKHCTSMKKVATVNSSTVKYIPYYMNITTDSITDELNSYDVILFNDNTSIIVESGSTRFRGTWLSRGGVACHFKGEPIVIQAANQQIEDEKKIVEVRRLGEFTEVTNLVNSKLHALIAKQPVDTPLNRFKNFLVYAKF